MNTERPKTKEAAQEWVNNGGKCAYRYGYKYRGASTRVITTEKARELLPAYHFGMGFYEISWITLDGEDTLLFNEFSENDLL